MKNRDERTQFCLACEHTKHTCGLLKPDDESLDEMSKKVHELSSMPGSVFKYGMACARWGEAKPKSLHGYNLSVLKDNLKQDYLWIQKDDGEGMGLSKESLDKIWKEYF